MTLLARDASHRAKHSFVVFSDDFGAHPSSCQHIFRHVIPDHEVLWVNTIGMRNPTWSASDLGKALYKLKGMVLPPRRRSIDERRLSPAVCQPFMLPFSRFKGVRAFNARSVARTVGSRLRGSGVEPPLFVSTVPNAGDYTHLMQHSTVVYYCVDDFAAWPGLDARVVRDMEQRLIERADRLIAASEALLERLAAHGKPVSLLTHGVDLELFAGRDAPVHPCLREIPAPRVGFFGLIDPRIDEQLVKAVARQMPHISFVFAGPLGMPSGTLAVSENVHLVGPLPYGELPSLIAGLEVLLLPYRTEGLGNRLSPLKLKEYLATGKPIVSTPIVEAMRQSRYVTLANSPAEWLDAISGALGSDVDKRQSEILPQLEQESWASKARTFLDLCAETARRREGQSADRPSPSSGDRTRMIAG